jgi:glycosyltransferase involved in cell wall biosynthesis
VRVVHIVESLDTGAVEGWLLTMLRTACSKGILLDWTFYCVLPRVGRNDQLARDLGATVAHSPVEMRETVAFVTAMRRFIRAGDFHVLHCHHDIVSALYLVAAAGLPIRRRIVHAHNADLGVPTPNGRKAAILRTVMRRFCLAASDCIVGISRHTLETMLGRAARAERCETVVYYGMDTTLYHGAPPDRAALLADLDLPNDAEILLFAGRMVWYKNPLFVLDILGCLRRSNPRAVALFAGSGPLVPEVDRLARERGLADCVRVLGWRNDTAHLMRVSDVFVFPRVESQIDGFGIEGLGLVVVEAQAAGLTAIISRGVPEDAIVTPEQCRVIPLSDGPEVWAAATEKALTSARARQEVAVAAIDSSRFSASTGLESLQRLYAI